MKSLLKSLKTLAQPAGIGHIAKPAVNDSRSNRTLIWLAGGTTLMGALLSNAAPTVAQTVFPSLTNFQFQTSSPRRCANIGDWYTTDGTTGTTGTTPTNCGSAFSGQNSTSNDKIHRFTFNITQAQITAGGGSVTITVNDAENAAGGSIPDEVSGTGDPTQFSLRDANGNIIGSPITVPSGSANGTTVTFTINTPGTYQLTSVSGARPISGDNTADLNDDDNTFTINVSVSNVSIGAFQGSSQFSVDRTTSYSFYFLKPPTASSTTLSLRNFDFDSSPSSIQYISPGGGTTAGTVSGNAVWNGSTGNLNSGGDSVTATRLTDAGVWEIKISNTSATNQFILEANADGQRLVLYDTRPTSAGNFTITANGTLSTTIGTTVCHPFTVKNLFATNDIINLTTANTAANYTVQLRNAAGTTALTDTDGNGQVDTGILTPQQSANFNLCVTPNAGATNPDVTRINAISFMDTKADAANNTTLFVDKTTTIPIRISGTVWQDKNGSANSTFSNIFTTGETGTNAGGLNAILVNSNGKVIASSPVSNTGTYTFNNISSNQTGVTIRLSTTVGTAGNDAPPVWNPTGTVWTNTSPLTTAAFNISTSDLANQDFGIEQLPDTNNVSSSYQINPGGTNRVQAVTLSGTDPEDGTLGSGKSFKIFAPATNGKIYYNNVEIAGTTTINNYNPTLLTVDPNNGSVNVTFTYAAIDAAGKEDSTPATATMPFASVAAGSPFACDGRFYQIKAASGQPSILYQVSHTATSVNTTTVSGVAIDVFLNGMGYNRLDNYMYALYRGNVGGTDVGVNVSPTSSGLALYKIGQSGAESVGLISGLPNGFVATAADIDGSGNFYVTRAGDGNTDLYKINLTTRVATNIGLANSTPNLGDMSFNPIDGKFYGVAATTLYIIDLSTTPAGVSTKTITGVTSSGWGTTFMDVAGNLYAYDNTAGEMYRIDLNTGAATLLDSSSIASGSDGAACVFPPQRVDVVKSAGTVSAANANKTIFDIPYTVKVKNTGTAAVSNLQVSENLKLTFKTGSPTIAIKTVPAVTGGSLTLNPSFNGTSDFKLLAGSDTLAAGAERTITFTVRVTYPNAAAVPTTVQNNQVYASSSSLANNPGYEFLGANADVPIPPGDLLAVDTSTNSATTPATAGGDTPSPTPITLSTAVSSAPNLLLVKRITAIGTNSAKNPNDNTDLSKFVNDTNSTNDDHANWPTSKDSYLRGAISGGNVKPGDEVEYTIYFLNTQAAAKNVTVCDLVPANQTFVETTYDANNPKSGIGFLNSTILPIPTTPNGLTNAADSDGGRYYPPGDPNTPTTCKKFNNSGVKIAEGVAANTDGAIVVEVAKGATNLPASTGAGNPANSYGFVRFRAKVK
jgi:uncharacterized repeat protein (TIGR01451 family)